MPFFSRFSRSSRSSRSSRPSRPSRSSRSSRNAASSGNQAGSSSEESVPCRLATYFMAAAGRFANGLIIPRDTAKEVVQAAVQMAANANITASSALYLAAINNGPVPGSPCIASKSRPTGCSVHPEEYWPDCTSPDIPIREMPELGRAKDFFYVNFECMPTLPGVFLSLAPAIAQQVLSTCMVKADEITARLLHDTDARMAELEKLMTGGVVTYVNKMMEFALLWEQDPQLVHIYVETFAPESGSS